MRCLTTIAEGHWREETKRKFSPCQEMLLVLQKLSTFRMNKSVAYDNVVNGMMRLHKSKYAYLSEVFLALGSIT